MTNFQKRETVSALLIGGSGHGKSEFILSFINEEDREKVPASGEGQTTRTSMEYHVNCEKKVPLQIKIKLKKPEKFIEERLLVVDNSLDSIPKTKRMRNLLKNKLINDKAFFNIMEFGDKVSAHIEDIYNKIFDEDFFDAIDEKVIQEETDKNYFVTKEFYDNFKIKVKEMVCEEKLEEYSDEGDDSELHGNVLLSNCFKVFFNYVYKYCRKTILDKYTKEELKDLSNKSASEIASFLKTEDKKISYSALVETVIVNTYVAHYYKGLFEKINIGKIIFVDTYGLNHATTGSEQTIKNRYQQLLNREYPSIKTVLYLRNVNNTEAPTDLQQNIPLLFSIAPTVVPYIIFTKVDELKTEFTVSKAYTIIKDLEDEIGCRLEEAGVSEELIENRLKNLLDNRIAYCSYIGKQGYEGYLEENTKGIKKIFAAIRYKKHLGSNLIPINKMKLNSLKEVLDVEKILNKDSDFDFYNVYYPSRTKGALSSRLQRGILGFEGSTTVSTYWSDIISEAINSRFNNIVDAYNWSEYLDSQNVLTSLSELFLIFADSICKCAYMPSQNFFNYINDGLCLNCNKKEECIKEIIYNEKKMLISYKTSPVTSWLTDVYSFSDTSENAKSSIQKIINHCFEVSFIEQCRQHNARVIALEIDGDNTQDDIDRKLDKYYSDYDSNLNTEEKVEFEQIINSYME